MNFEQIKEFLNKIPTTLLLVSYLAYLGFEYYQFMEDPGSPFQTATKNLESSKELNTKLESKLKELNEFVKKLDVKKSELRKASQELQELKGSIPESFDIPRFMEMALTEAKKSGMTVQSLSPKGTLEREYYAEHNFGLTCQGTFNQLLTFLERMTSLTEIVRVDSFKMIPVPNTSGKLLELTSEVELKTYRYLGSQADSVGKADAGSGGGDSSGQSSVQTSSRSETSRAGGSSPRVAP